MRYPRCAPPRRHWRRRVCRPLTTRRICIQGKTICPRPAPSRRTRIPTRTASEGPARSRCLGALGQVGLLRISRFGRISQQPPFSGRPANAACPSPHVCIDSADASPLLLLFPVISSASLLVLFHCQFVHSFSLSLSFYVCCFFFILSTWLFHSLSLSLSLLSLSHLLPYCRLGTRRCSGGRFSGNLETPRASESYGVYSKECDAYGMPFPRTAGAVVLGTSIFHSCLLLIVLVGRGIAGPLNRDSMHPQDLTLIFLRVPRARCSLGFRHTCALRKISARCFGLCTDCHVHGAASFISVYVLCSIFGAGTVSGQLRRDVIHQASGVVADFYPYTAHTRPPTYLCICNSQNLGLTRWGLTALHWRLFFCTFRVYLDFLRISRASDTSMQFAKSPMFRAEYS